ncbi:MAG: methyltransferase domain-containing protein [Alphaproteobacteria bacterium]|nr:methyltransferase domain-containing protein [Alphaproteobacteria bacterium]
MIIKHYAAGKGEDAEAWSSDRIQQIGALEDRYFKGLKWSLFKKYVNRQDIFVEAGCGSGDHLRAVQDHIGATCIGIDFASELLDELNTRFPDYRWEQGDVRQLSRFKDASVDVMASFGVVEHIETGPYEAINEMKRVIKPGGMLIFSVPRNAPLAILGLIKHAIFREPFLFSNKKEIVRGDRSMVIVKKFDDERAGVYPFSQYAVTDRVVYSYFPNEHWTVVEKRCNGLIYPRLAESIKKLLGEVAYENICVLEMPGTLREKVWFRFLAWFYGGNRLLILKRTTS